jgi:glucosamine-6-phosphate deaminase
VTRHRTYPVDVQVHADPEALGEAAAKQIGECLRALTDSRESVRVMFASAPSQRETLIALAAQPGIAWSRITAFHMDEYIGLPTTAPQGFGNWLRETFFDSVPLRATHLLDAGALPQAEAERYGALVTSAPIDAVLLGIGVNGHLAFNDPPADLQDPEPVRVVTLHPASRAQQVQDGLFAAFNDVPTRALTVTIPILLSAARVFCLAPGASKAAAVRDALAGPISGDCPATALRTHPAVTMHLDLESAPRD